MTSKSVSCRVFAGALTFAVASVLGHASRSVSNVCSVGFKTYSVVPKTLMLLEPLDSGYPSAELGTHFDVVSASKPLRIQVSNSKSKGINNGEEGFETLQDGQVLVKLLCLSADPYQRDRIKGTNPLTGAVSSRAARAMEGFVSGVVLASNDPNWTPGTLFGAHLPYTTVQVVDFSKKLGWKLPESLNEEQISLGIGVLGMPGATAYGGLIGTLKPKKGETLYVSGAAGAVGSLVGELGKNLFDLKTIGSVGGPAKIKQIKEVHGYDVGIDRKTLPKWGENSDWSESKEELVRRLKEAAPDGIDMYFDNVGAEYFEAAFQTLRTDGRIAICGQIATYNNGEQRFPTIHPLAMIYAQQRIEGFLSSPWLTGQKGNFHQEMAQWLQEGKVTARETKFYGISRWPAAFRSLFVNTETKAGKVAVMLGADDFEGEVME